MFSYKAETVIFPYLHNKFWQLCQGGETCVTLREDPLNTTNNSESPCHTIRLEDETLQVKSGRKHTYSPDFFNHFNNVQHRNTSYNRERTEGFASATRPQRLLLFQLCFHYQMLLIYGSNSFMPQRSIPSNH